MVDRRVKHEVKEGQIRCGACKKPKYPDEFGIASVGKNKGKRASNCLVCARRSSKNKCNKQKADREFVPNRKTKIPEDYDGSDVIERMEREAQEYDDLGYYPNTWNLGN